MTWKFWDQHRFAETPKWLELNQRCLLVGIASGLKAKKLY